MLSSSSTKKDTVYPGRQSSPRGRAEAPGSQPPGAACYLGLIQCTSACVASSVPQKEMVTFFVFLSGSLYLVDNPGLGVSSCIAVLCHIYHSPRIHSLRKAGRHQLSTWTGIHSKHGVFPRRTGCDVGKMARPVSGYHSSG